MKRIIETSKGEFLIADYKELDWKDRFYVKNGLKEECRVLKLNGYQASLITGKKVNSIDDLYRLIESQGIEITNNTYIFKV